MNTFKIAHIREQGVDMIIVPLSSSFGARAQSDQDETIEALQQCAAAAGLAGTVVPVWRSGSSYRFICPTNWTPFFRSLSWNQITRSINRTLTCG